MEDRDIIALFNERQERGISEIKRKYGKLCYHLAYNILNNHEDAEETVADSYLVAWGQIPPEVPKSLKNYLCILVRNLSLTKFHHNSAVKRNSLYDVALEELAENLADKKTPEDDLILKEFQENWNLFLDKLDYENRSIFILRYWYGESVSNIATQFHCKPNAISSRLKRTRKKLKVYFEKLEEST